MTELINWGIIGCGNVTEVKSGPAFNKVENSSLVAVMRRIVVSRLHMDLAYSVCDSRWTRRLLIDPSLRTGDRCVPIRSHCVPSVCES